MSGHCCKLIKSCCNIVSPISFTIVYMFALSAYICTILDSMYVRSLTKITKRVRQNTLHCKVPLIMHLPNLTFHFLQLIIKTYISKSLCSSLQLWPSVPYAANFVSSHSCDTESKAFWQKNESIHFSLSNHIVQL